MVAKIYIHAGHQAPHQKIREACYGPDCRSAAGPDGLCRICRDSLPGRQRRKLLRSRKCWKVLGWLVLKPAVRALCKFRRQAGRN